MLIIHDVTADFDQESLYVLCHCTLMPLAFLISKLIRSIFRTRRTPHEPRILLSVGQIPHLLIAMWVFSAVPEKMLMIIAMIFGAHLLPFSWLYKSKSYMAFAIAIPFLALLVGLYFAPYVLAIAMVGVEIVFSLCLVVENRAAM